jgi:thiol-disulfide isomerase/thioredoxin
MGKMKHLLLIGCCLLLAKELPAQNPAIVHLQDFQNWCAQDNDTLYVLNFWSTWCRPCVAEMPHFDRMQKEMEAQKVKVIFLSLDFKSQYDSHLVPFLKKKKLYSTVVFFDEPKINDWIDKVDPSWSGAIPVTLFVQHSKEIRQFHEGDFTYESLTSTINSLISQKDNEKD